MTVMILFMSFTVEALKKKKQTEGLRQENVYGVFSS